MKEDFADETAKIRYDNALLTCRIEKAEKEELKLKKQTKELGLKLQEKNEKPWETFMKLFKEKED